MAQVLVPLLLVFFDDSNITTIYWGIRGLASLASLIWMRIFLKRLTTQNLIQLASIFIFIITVSNRRVMVFLSLRIFLVSEFLIFL